MFFLRKFGRMPVCMLDKYTNTIVALEVVLNHLGTCRLKNDLILGLLVEDLIYVRKILPNLNSWSSMVQLTVRWFFLIKICWSVVLGKGLRRANVLILFWVDEDMGCVAIKLEIYYKQFNTLKLYQFEILSQFSSMQHRLLFL